MRFRTSRRPPSAASIARAAGRSAAPPTSTAARRPRQRVRERGERSRRPALGAAVRGAGRERHERRCAPSQPRLSAARCRRRAQIVRRRQIRGSSGPFGNPSARDQVLIVRDLVHAVGRRRPRASAAGRASPSDSPSARECRRARRSAPSETSSAAAAPRRTRPASSPRRRRVTRDRDASSKTTLVDRRAPAEERRDAGRAATASDASGACRGARRRSPAAPSRRRPASWARRRPAGRTRAAFTVGHGSPHGHG